ALEEAELHLLGLGQHGEDGEPRRLVNEPVEVEDRARRAFRIGRRLTDVARTDVAHPWLPRRLFSSRSSLRNSRCWLTPTTRSAKPPMGACGCSHNRYEPPASTSAACATRNTPAMNSSGVRMNCHTRSGMAATYAR